MGHYFFLCFSLLFHWCRSCVDRADPSLTLTRFCALLKTALFYGTYEALPQRFQDSLGCKDCCTNTTVSTYLLVANVNFLTTNWVTLQRHSSLPTAAASASSKVNPNIYRSFLTIPLQFVLGQLCPLLNPETFQYTTRDAVWSCFVHRVQL